MPVTLDPSAAAVIAAFRAANRPPYETMTPVEARAAQALGRPVIQPDPPAIASVEQIVIASDAAQIPARVYKPLTLAQRDGLSAGVIFFHGGGWTIGDLDGYEVVCKSIATEAQMIVVSVDYRLAPEHRFPAAVDDAIAATKWIAENAVRFGIDPNRLIVSGDSAGGNLSAVVAIHSRDHGGPKIAGQALIYPATEAECSHPSHKEEDTSVLLTHPLIKWFYDHYIPNKDDNADWRASPARVKDLSGLPRAYVITAGADPLRDEGDEYAERLRKAGVSVVHSYYPGQFHGFISFGRLLPESSQLIREIGSWLRQFN